MSWIFQRTGVIRISGKDLDEEQLLAVCLEAGADDLEDNGEGYSVYSEPANMTEVREALEEAGYVIEGSEIDNLPKNTVPIQEKEEAEKLLRFLETLEDHDDVQNVYANFDIPDEIMEEIAG